MEDIDERELLHGIEQRPDDDEVRTVYADWLEAQGQPVPAEFLRTQMALKAAGADTERLGQLGDKLRALALRPELSREFRRAASRPTIEGCETRLMFACPNTWDKMQATDDPSVRRCDACAKEVQYVDRIEQARTIALRGGCIAVDPIVARWPGDLTGAAPMAGAVMPHVPPPILSVPMPAPPPHYPSPIMPPAMVDPKTAAALLAIEEPAGGEEAPSK